MKGSLVMKIAFMGVSLVVLSPICQSVGVAAGSADAVAISPGLSREAHYLLQEENEKLIDMLEKLISAALESAKSKGEEGDSGASGDGKSLASKLETAMEQVRDVAEAAQGYASAEDDLILKTVLIEDAIFSHKEKSPELMSLIVEFADGQLRSDDALRTFLESIKRLMESVIPQELSHALRNEENGAEILDRLVKTIDDVSRRLDQDTRRRFYAFAKVTKWLASSSSAVSSGGAGEKEGKKNASVFRSRDD